MGHLDDVLAAAAPPRDCPVCPHPIAAHDVTGCVKAGMCACAVPGSELELAARRAGRLLEDHELAPDLVINDVDDHAAATDTLGQSPDSSQQPAESSQQGVESSETPGERPIPDRGGPEESPGQLHLAADPADPAAPSDPDDPPPAGMLRTGPMRGTGRRLYDWPAIKRRYVEGHPASDGSGVTEWPSLDAVALHYGLPAARVREKSAIEGWVGARQKWQAQMEATRQQARANALAKSATEVDTGALNASKLGLQLCMAVLRDRARVVQEQQQSGATGNRITVSSLELSRLAQAVDLWHRIGLRAVGDTEVSRLEITGAGGRPIEIATELKRDDPQRLAGVLSVLTAAGLGDLFGGGDPRGALEAHPGDDGVYTTEPPGS